MTFRIKIFLPLLLAILLFLEGCWDVEEVEKKSFLTGIGVDSVADDQVLLTMQIPNPTAMLPICDQPPKGKLFYTISTTGSTVLNVFAKLEAKSSNTLDTAQTKVIIFGRKAAEKGLKAYFDFLGRFPRINPQANLVMAEADAGSLLKVELAKEILPSLYIMDFFTKDSKKGATYPITLWRFLQKIDNPAIDPFLPIIRYDSNEQIFIIEGIAAFIHDRYVFSLTPEETKIFCLLNEGLENAAFVFPWHEHQKVGFHFTRSRSKYVWETPDTIRIKINADGYLLEETGSIQHFNNKITKEIEKMVAQKLEIEAQNLLLKIQKNQTDILGIGRVVRAKTYGKWSEAKWRKLYPRLKIKVKFNFILSRSGRMA